MQGTEVSTYSLFCLQDVLGQYCDRSETHSQLLCGEREYKLESSTEFLPSVIGEHCRRGKVGVRKPIGHLESKAHQINQSIYGPTEDEPGKHSACMDLH